MGNRLLPLPDCKLTLCCYAGRVATVVEGGDIVLGRGTFGLVLEGIKGGVQPVVSCCNKRTGMQAGCQSAFCDLGVLGAPKMLTSLQMS
jgi:hypothetical protein